MSRHPRALALLAAFAASCTPILAGADVPAKKQDLVGPLITLAQEHRDAKRYQQAIVALRTAWAEEQRPEIACNRGLIAGRLGLFQESAEFLHRCLQQPPPGLSDAQTTILRAQLAMARQEVASVTVEVNVPGADVLVDGRIMGRTPLASELFVEKGTYEIGANLSGRLVSEKVTVGKGDYRTVSLRIPPIFAGVLVSPPSPSPEPMDLQPFVIISGVTFGVSAATSIGTFIATRVYHARSEDAASEALRLQPWGCVGPTFPDACNVYQRDGDTAFTFQKVAIASVVVAGVAGAATIVLAVVNHNRLKGASTVQAMTGKFVW